jgi:hypothetical protein
VPGLDGFDEQAAAMKHASSNDVTWRRCETIPHTGDSGAVLSRRKIR